MIRTKRLYRSRRNRTIAGVAGGLAEYLEVDPTIVRLGFVVAALLFHVFTIAAYVVAWLVVPDESAIG